MPSSFSGEVPTQLSPQMFMLSDVRSDTVDINFDKAYPRATPWCRIFIPNSDGLLRYHDATGSLVEEECKTAQPVFGLIRRVLDTDTTVTEGVLKS